MANLKIIRYGSIPDLGTPGEFYCGGMSYYSLEKEWLKNTPFISCVPVGTYELVKHSSPKHPNTWALVNEQLGISHEEKPNVPRNEILLHPFNFLSESEGCIGAGKILGAGWDTGIGVYGLKIVHSQEAIQAILAFLDAYKDEKHTLTIEWKNYEK